MKCLLCGRDLPEQAKFCDSCGARVIENSIGDNGVYANLNSVSANNITTDNTKNDVSEENLFTNVNIDSINGNIGMNNDINQNTNIEIKNNINQDTNTGLYENNKIADNNLNNDINTVNSVNFNNEVNSANLNNSNNVIEHQNITNSNSDLIDASMIKKKKNKKTPIILIIVLLLIAAVTGLLVYYFMYMTSSPKSVFTTGMRNVTSKLLVNENSKYTTMTTTFDIKSNIKTTDNSLNQIFNITNNIGLKGSVSTDYTNKIINGNINISYDNNTLTNVVVYGENSNLYLQLQGLYDKYISMPVDSYSEMFNTNKEELKNVKNGIDNAFEVALKDKYLKEKSTTINVGGNKKKVKANILTLDSKNSVEFSKDFQSYLAKDDKFIKAIAKLTGTDESLIKSNLSGEITEALAEGEKLVVTIYTTLSNKFAGVEFQAIESDNKTSVVALYKVDNNNYELVVKENGISYSCNLNIKNENNSKVYTISSVEGGNSIAISFGTNTTYNGTVKKLDVSNSISYTALTEVDSTMIQNNLMQNKAFMAIMTDIYALSGNSDI